MGQTKLLRELDDETAAAEQALHDRGLLALWFIRLRLEQELDRSRRAGHQLSVVALGPTSKKVPDAALEGAAATVKATARHSDLVGWFGLSGLIVVIPDGDAKGTLIAAKRWENQIWLKTMHLGAVKWKAFALTDPTRYENADQVLEAIDKGLRAQTSRCASSD